MPILKDAEVKGQTVAPGVSRKHIHLNSLMTAVVDFTSGPKEAPDPPHSHLHEQISYVAAGELYVFIDGQKTHLKQGDLFAVPGGVPHCIQPLSEFVRIIDSFSPIREDFL
jgi:quercetin dioxygenase-like cupin family protein